MKKTIISIITLMILLLILVGCTPTNPSDRPYITSVTPDKNFASEGEKVNIVVSVTNPTKINYNGNVLIQADNPECFGMRTLDIKQGNTEIKGYSTPITVQYGSQNNVLLTMSIPASMPKECYDPTTNHRLTIFILQGGEPNNAQVIDVENKDFSLFKKE